VPIIGRSRLWLVTSLPDAGRFIVAQGKYVGASLTHRSLRLLLMGYFGYCLARKASRVAIVVYAFDIAGVRGAAAVAIAQMFPASVLAPIGAAVADRFDPARVLALGYGIQGVFLAATGVLMSMGFSLTLVALTSAVAASAFAVTRPVYLATLPDVVDYPDELTLGNAGSAWVDGMASVIGPLLAGLGLVLIGGGNVMICLGFVCFLSGLISLRLVVRRRVVGVRTSVRDVVLGGLSAIRRDRQVADLVGLTAAQYTVVGLLDVLLVVYVVDVAGDESALAGLLAAAIGIGSTLGGLGSVVLAGKPRLSVAVLVGGAVCGIPIALLGVGPGLALAAVFLVGYGVGKSVVTVAAQTLLHRTVSDLDAARVFGVQEGVIQAGMAIGALLGPLLVLALGPRGALVATGVLLPIASLAARRSLRRLDARAYVPGPVFALLHRVPFLSVLPLRTLEQLSRQAQVRDVGSDIDVIRQGDSGEHYYVIASGTAVVITDGTAVRHLGPGQGFGEIALLRDIPRTATVRTTSAASLVALERDPFIAAVTGTTPAHEAAHRTADDHLDDDARRDDSSA
jgi:MFS family permease